MKRPHNINQEIATYILESISDAVIITDLKFRIIGWNKAAEDTYGWKEEEIFGKKVNKTLITNAPKDQIKKMVAVLHKEGIWKGNIVQQKRDGTQINITASVSVVRDELGNPIRYVAVNRDNTEYKAIEERLQYKSEVSKILSSSRSLYDSLQEIASLAIPRMADWCSIDLINDEGGVDLAAVACNDPAVIPVWKKIREIVLSGAVGNITLRRVLTTGEPVFFPRIQKGELRKKSKTDKFFSLVQKIPPTANIMVPLKAQERTIGVVSFALIDKSRNYTQTDLELAEQISSRISQAIENVKLSEAVDNEKNRLTVLLSTVPGIVWEAWGKPDEKEQRVDFISKHAEKMLGYTVEQWLSTPNFWLTIVHPLDYERAKNEAAAIFNSGKGGVSRFRWITKKGKVIWVEARSTVVKDKNGNPVGMRGVNMDISDRIELEHRKDEFLGIASHELRTPLTSIKGYIQILKRLIQNQEYDKILSLLQRTDIYTDKLNGLINDLLDVSKIQAGKLVLNKSTFDIDDMVSESIASIQPTTSKHSIIYKPRVSKTITGDRDRLEQVITNLLSNAIKYSPQADKIEVKSKSVDGIVKIAVKDFGIGIPKNKQPFLFQRYYRVEDIEKKFSGMGIGLYICNEIINRHNGKISVKSDGKVGTTFEVELPVN